MRIVIFFLFLSQAFLAQELSFISKTELQADHFIGLDSYKHLYFTKNNVLHKQGELGSFFFQDFQLGPIASVDIINPLNIVVFYAEMNTVVFLDNRLNEKERINFNELPSFLNVTTATNAGNNKLWIFNTDTQQLELYHYRNQQRTLVSQPFPGKLIAQASNFNSCFLLTESKLRHINLYGSLLFENTIEGFSKIALNNETLLGIKENNLFLLKQNTVHPLPVTFIEKPIKDLQLTQDFLYLYDGKTLYTFTLTQPKQ